VEYSWTPEQMLGGSNGKNELMDMMVDLLGMFVEFFH